MQEPWSDEKLIEYLTTIGFDGKLALLLAAGNVQADLSLLVIATKGLADACSDDAKTPASFVLTEADQKKIRDANALLKEVLTAVSHRAEIFIQVLQNDHRQGEPSK